ncbi:MAG: hypothetical protein ABI026_07000 [Gemmatimonadaceae bacterium]
MPDTLVQFDEPQLSADGRMFIAEVRGQRLPSGLWEAWIEFHPRIGGDPVRTPPETEQLSRGDLRFWAAGITRDRLADALERALSPRVSTDSHRVVTSSGSLSPTAQKPLLETTRVPDEMPVLDPMAVYQHSGEYTLRQELRGLDAEQLADIISAYSIEGGDVTDLARTYEDALAETIVAAAQHCVDSKRKSAPETGPGLKE